MPYFDITKDMDFPCLCEGCLTGKWESEMSKWDSHYCLICQPIIEADSDRYKPVKGRPTIYKTVMPREAPEPVLSLADNTLQYESGHEKLAPIPKHGTEIMSTVNAQKSEVDIIQPRVGKTTRGKRGPKHKRLPLELVTHWAREGMGSKSIATQLKREQGIEVSYRTVQRVLAGQTIQGIWIGQNRAAFHAKLSLFPPAQYYYKKHHLVNAHRG